MSADTAEFWGYWRDRIGEISFQGSNLRFSADDVRVGPEQPELRAQDNILLQLVPGAVRPLAPRAGHGLARASCTLIYYLRRMSDQVGDQERHLIAGQLVNDGNSLYEWLDQHRARLVNRLASTTGRGRGLLVSTLEETGSPTLVPNAPGWARISDRYRTIFDQDWALWSRDD